MSNRGAVGRDEDLLRVVWSFGAVLPEQLRALLGCSRGRLGARLSPLVRARALQRLPYRGSTCLYALGARVAEADPSLVEAWLPPPALYRHTLLTVDLVVAFREHACPVITSYAGEGELRCWVGRGEAIPDGSLTWQIAGRSGQFLVETDRGTEPEKIWRAKLARYRRLWEDEAVLVSAPNRARATRIATLAHALRIDLLAGVHRDLVEATDPPVFDALAHRRHSVREALEFRERAAASGRRGEDLSHLRPAGIG